MECPVCFTDQSVRTVWCTLPCQHAVCYTCLERIAHSGTRRCPLCRDDLDTALPSNRYRPDTTDQALDAFIRRVQAAAVLQDAVAHGAAPRNRRAATPPPEMSHT